MERRSFDRYLSGAGIRLYQADGEFLCNGTILNISKSGMMVTFLDTGKLGYLKSKEKISFQVQYSSGAIMGICSIVWVNNDASHVGLKFTKIDDESCIENLMEYSLGPRPHIVA